MKYASLDMVNPMGLRVRPLVRNFEYPADFLLQQFNEQRGSVWVGAFSDDALVGVNASLPRMYNVGGRTVSGGVPTYLSVDPRFRRRGIAKHLIDSVLEFHRERGDSVLLPFFDRAGNGMAAYGKAASGMEVLWEGKWMFRLLQPEPFWESVGQDVMLRQLLGGGGGEKRKGLLARMISPLAVDPPPMGKDFRPAMHEDAASLREVLNRSDSDFRLHWNAASVRRLLDGARCHVVVGTAGKKGPASAVVYHERTLMSRGPMKLAWFDGFWGDGKRRIDNILAALRHAMDGGCAVAMWPDTGVMSKSAFLRVGFLPSPFSFTIGGIGLNGFEVKAGAGYHIDVR
jgi:GNAT superfamily N-acetyltransferase